MSEQTHTEQSVCRELRMLAEAAAALKRLLHGDRATWLDWDVLRESWAMCQARGVQPPEGL